MKILPTPVWNRNDLTAASCSLNMTMTTKVIIWPFRPGRDRMQSPAGNFDACFPCPTLVQLAWLHEFLCEICYGVLNICLHFSIFCIFFLGIFFFFLSLSLSRWYYVGTENVMSWLDGASRALDRWPHILRTYSHRTCNAYSNFTTLITELQGKICLQWQGKQW